MAQAFSVDNRISRRSLIEGSAGLGAGLVFGVYVPQRGRAQTPTASPVAAPALSDGQFAPNAFVRIAPDNTVTIISKHVEWGQGIHTTLATLIAEELDADWSQMAVVPAPANAELYVNLAFGFQGTAGSNGVRNSYEQYRQAGATARAMLVAAASERWSVPAEEITVTGGVVEHVASGESATFGDLAIEASELPIPQDITLKDPATFTLIGNPDVSRLDTPDKVAGTALFALDLQLDDMQIAVVARSPRFGGTVASFIDTDALAVDGVEAVVAIPTGVAVVANSFWSALKGREALTIEWDDSAAEARSTAELLSEYRALLDTPGDIARQDGDVTAALEAADRTLVAEYSYPYLAHLPLEPVVVVTRLTPDHCDIWTGDGGVQFAQEGVMELLGFGPEQVSIHSVLEGGSFGRKDGSVVEAVEIARALGGSATVKLIWTREDDFQHSFYRPMYVERITAGLDAEGEIVAWHHRVVGQSIFPWEPVNGVDFVSVDGAANIPYNIPNILVDLHTTETGIPINTLRGTAALHTTFSVETMIDDIAAAVGKDPLELRLSLLATDPNEKDIEVLSIIEADRPNTFAQFPRQLTALEVAAEAAGWGNDLPAGTFRGVAVGYGFHSSVAAIAEVTTGENGVFHVDRVVCAIDCGVAVSPSIVQSQTEGCIAWGLGILLHGGITFDEGRVVESSFEEHPVLRIDEMPRVEVHIVPSTAPPSGAGQIGVATVGPAVANAIFAATGERDRDLPILRSVPVA